MRKQKQNHKQIDMIKKDRSDYGGDLLKTRKGRAKGRPLSVQSSMHLVLRSSQAVGEMSFKKHRKKIEQILNKFATKYGVKVLDIANAGNHIHLQIKLSSRHTYKPFIRAITAAIMMAVTGVNKWASAAKKRAFKHKKFWDLRPFTRILTSFRELKYLRNYLAVNRLESLGYTKRQARAVLYWNPHTAPESG